MSSKEAVDRTLLVEPSGETKPREQTEAERAGLLHCRPSRRPHPALPSSAGAAER